MPRPACFTQKGMKEVFEQAVKGRAFEYAVVPVAAIDFSAEVFRACETNMCGKYNKCWTCPPAAGSPESQKEKILAFSSAFVFTTRHELEDSFDYGGMANARDRHNSLVAEMHARFGKTNPVYGAGGCVLCETCTWPQPCRFPEKIFPPIEAAGIDVIGLSRAANLRYNNGKNTVTYFSMILFNE